MTKQTDASLNSVNPLLLRSATYGGAPRIYQNFDDNFLNLMRWAGKYDLSRAMYLKNEVVEDDGWLMIANKDTSGRPAPQASGPSSFEVEDAPAWSANTFAGLVSSGHEYTFSKPGIIQEVQIYADEVAAGTTHRILVIDATDPLNIRYINVFEPFLVQDEWAVVSIPRLLVSDGDVIQILHETMDIASTGSLTAPWFRTDNDDAVATDPGAGKWGTSDDLRTLRIHKTDFDSASQAAGLATMVAGTTVRFESQADATLSMGFTLNVDPVDQTTHYSWSDVTFDGPGVGGRATVNTTCDMVAVIPTAGTTKYVQLASQWPGSDPDWAAMKGLLFEDGVDQSADADAFGVRMRFQPAYVSPDWDFMSRQW